MGRGQSVPSLFRKMLGMEHNKQGGDNASGDRREASINGTSKSLVPSMGDNDDACERGGRSDTAVDGTQAQGSAVDIAITDVAGGELDGKETPVSVPVPVPVPVSNVGEEGGKKSHGIFRGGGGQTSRGERDGGLPPTKGGGRGGNWQEGGGGGGGGGLGGGGGGGGGGYGIDIGSGNCAVTGNDIRIRNVFKHLSEDMQIGSQNVSEADNVISINLSAHSNPTT